MPQLTNPLHGRFGATRLTAAAAAALLGLAAAGCGGPSADDVRQRTSALLKPMISDTAKALDVAAEHPTLKMLLDKIDLGELLPSDDAPSVVEPAVPPPPPPPPPAGSEADPMPEPPQAVPEPPQAVPEPPQAVPEPPPPVEERPRQTISDQAAELAGELDDFLARYVFRDDAVESSSGGKTTFLIRGAVVCDAVDGNDGAEVAAEPLPKPVSGSGAGDAVDTGAPIARPRPAPAEAVEDNGQQRCIDSVDRLGLRIDATLVDGGVNLDLRVGAADGALVTIELRPARFTIKVYLPAVRQAASDIAAVIDEQLPDGFPTVMKGVIALTLKKVDPRLVAELAVLEPITIAGQTEGAAYSGELPASNPLLSIGYSTADGALDAAVDWGATDILLPANAMFREELTRAFDQPLRLLLGGLQAKLKATAAGQLQIDQLGLGQLNQLRFGSDVLAQLELNPGAEHRLSMTVAPWQLDADELQCSLDPALDAQLELKLGRLDGYLRDPAPPTLADERYQLLLAAAAGQLPAVVPLGLGGVRVDAKVAEPLPAPTDGAPTDEPPAPAPAARPLVRVVQGALTLQSFVDPVKITVAPGQCLLDEGQAADDAAAPERPLAGLAAGACD